MDACWCILQDGQYLKIFHGYVSASKGIFHFLLQKYNNNYTAAHKALLLSMACPLYRMEQHLVNYAACDRRCMAIAKGTIEGKGTVETFFDVYKRGRKGK